MRLTPTNSAEPVRGKKAAGPSAAALPPLLEQPWLLRLVLIGATLAAYANSFGGAFLLDDEPHIASSPAIRTLHWPWEYLTSPRGLADLSLALNYAAGGLEPAGYHLVNLAIHLAAGLVLFGLLRRTLALPRWAASVGRTGPLLAGAIALLWLVHPLQTQAVTYVVQRTESLMALFYLLTLYGMVRYAAAPHWRWAALAVVACWAGMVSKQVMVTAPLVALLYDRTLVADSLGQALRRRWKLHAGLAASWLWLWVVMDFGKAVVAAEGGAGFVSSGVTAWQYALTQPRVIVHYLRLCVWPWPLCLDYWWPAMHTLTQAWPWTAAVAVLVLVSAWGLWRRHWAGLAGLLVFLVLAPTSSVVPIADLAVEHRMYLPLAGVLTVLVGAGWSMVLGGRPEAEVARRLPMVVSVAAALALAAGALTWQRNQDYGSATRMWENVLKTSPNNVRAHANLSAAYLEQHKTRAAVRHLEEALRLDPKHLAAHMNLGKLLMERGQWDEAMAHYQTVLGIKSDMAEAHYTIGVLLSRRGDLKGAIPYFRRAVELDPMFADVHTHLGATLAKMGRMEEAIAEFRQALRLDPNDQAARENLTQALAIQRQSGQRR